jgi:ferritin
MISKKVEEAINNQLNAELYSSYAYLAMSAYFESQDLSGFATWFRLQSNEEYGHAMKIFDYIHQIGGTVTLKEVKAPKTDWKDFVEVFRDTFDHEQRVTIMINKLVDLAIKEKDHATTNFMQWFISEQVEEEATSAQILKKMEMVGDSKAGLFMIDREMGNRATTE